MKLIKSGHSSAANDMVVGIMDWRLWLRLGWYDVVARYRRSWVGPFWMLATTVIFVVSLGAVYSILFKMSLRDYMPYVAIGTVTWSYISAVTSESLQTFVEAEVYIRQVHRSPIIYTLRVVWRNLIIFGNQLIVAFLVAVVFGKFSLAHMPLVAIGLMFLFLQAVWISIFLGILGTRFRDLTQVVQNIMQVSFFVTPILWMPTSLGDNSWIATINPFYHLIQLLRAPMLGQNPEVFSYVFASCFTLAGFVAAYFFYSKFRNRIVYWL
ncbi:ABC transporter permease [Microvirga antarctica]|uniref:ABC transporter permease n=1 Tax=Microvirga antarctica TaxID=2819233 RepID=UPI001B30DBB5|nr:ABC transporter permease [Microvirga antarctica]